MRPSKDKYNIHTIMNNKLALVCFLIVLVFQYVPLRSADKNRLLDLDDDFEVLDSTYTDDHEDTVMNVDDYGAVGDGISDDTQAFVDAWKDACSTKNSVLLVPEMRTYLVSATKFKGLCRGKTTVQIEGTIVAPGEPEDWDPDNPRLWLEFYKIKYTNFQGRGIIDAKGTNWWANSCKRNKSRPCKGAPSALTIYASSDIKVTDITIQNGQQMNMVISNCDSVLVSDVQVTAPGGSPNTDGIHITKSTNVVLKNAIIGTGDDCISIVSGSSNITMNNIICGPGHGISIGSLGKDHSIGIVENVTLDVAYLQNTTNGLRIKTWQGGSGHVKDITFQNVKMDRVANPIIIDQFYCDSKKSCHNQTSAVEISGIVYSNISGTTNSKHVMIFSCSDEVPCTNIVLYNVNLRSVNGGTVDTYCNSAFGEEDGNVQPPADCLSPYVMMMSSQKTDSNEHIIHTEL